MRSNTKKRTKTVLAIWGATFLWAATVLLGSSHKLVADSGCDPFFEDCSCVDTVEAALDQCLAAVNNDETTCRNSKQEYADSVCSYKDRDQRYNCGGYITTDPTTATYCPTIGSEKDECIGEQLNGSTQYTGKWTVWPPNFGFAETPGLLKECNDAGDTKEKACYDKSADNRRGCKDASND